MGNYIDYDYIIKRADKTLLEDVCDTTDLQNNDVLLQSIIDAEDKVDEYLESIYTVPLTTPSKTIKRTTFCLSMYYMYSYRYQSELPDNIVKDYEDCIKYLEDIQSQKQKVINQEELANEGTTIVINKEVADKYFSKARRSQIL